jgi:serine/threonine protein kinase
MNTSDAILERHPVEELAEEFVIRYRRGERPSLSEFVKQYPDIAAELGDIIQALLMLEDLGAASDETSATLPLPEKLGEYRIIREIGRGGMGVVYEAEQGDLGRRVALKVLPSAALLRPTHLERFRREARAAARLHHTNIIPVYGVGAQDGIHYYAMQHIPGRGLDEIIGEMRGIKSQPKADTAKAIVTPLSGTSQPGSSEYYRGVARVGLQIAEALAHAHEHGVLHRDVKPANVVLDETGNAWLGDFGLAQLRDEAPLTSTGSFVGTLRYLAPERFKNEGDARSDVYALGATLYELVTLKPIFDETDRARLIRQVTLDEPIKPRRVDPHIPKDLETLIIKAIAKNPADRYVTAGALADDLRRYLADRPVAARRITHWEQLRRWMRRNPLLAGLIATVFATLSVGLGATFWQWQRAQEETKDKIAALGEVEKQRSAAQRESQRAWQALRNSNKGMSATRKKPMAEFRRTLHEEMLRLYDEMSSDGHPEHLVDRAIIARGLGEAYSELGQPAKALASFSQSAAMLEETPDGPDIDYQRGTSHYCLGQWLYDARNFSEAEPAASRSVSELRRAVEIEPTAIPVRLQLAKSLHLLARTQRSLKQPDADEGQEAAVILQQVHVDDPKNIDVAIELARFHGEISRDWVTAGRAEQGLAAARSAVEIMDQLLAEWPNRCDVIENTAHACDALANANNKAKDKVAGLAASQRATAMYRLLVRQDPTDPSYQHAVAASLHNLGKILGDIQDPAEGLKLLDEGMQHIRLARTINPAHAQIRRTENQLLMARVLLFAFQEDHRNTAKAAAEMVQNANSGTDLHVEASHRLLNCILFVIRDNSLEPEERDRLRREYRDQAAAYLQVAADRGFANVQSLSKVPFRGFQRDPVFQPVFAKIAENEKNAAKPRADAK